ncbi:GNAT family N-acetyltransferase [Geodermatophilus sp. SYSU D00815]
MALSSSSCSVRTAQAEDLTAVLELVRQHRAEAHAAALLTRRPPGSATAAGFARLLADPDHRVVLAVADAGAGERVVGLAVLGVEPLSVVLGAPQVTVDDLVVHREHRRRGVGAALLAAAAAHAEEVGAHHVVASCGGHDPERLRFLSRLGFAPLATRRIVPRETLVSSLLSLRRSRLGVPVPRRAPAPGRRDRAVADG